jgi:hypothetical protein
MNQQQLMLQIVWKLLQAVGSITAAALHTIHDSGPKLATANSETFLPHLLKPCRHILSVSQQAASPRSTESRH